MSYRVGEFLFNVIGIIVIMFIVYLGVESVNKDEPDISSAHPVSQQKIGDEANPDILIIYEAEVDGETVYPTVIKEAE